MVSMIRRSEPKLELDGYLANGLDLHQLRTYVTLHVHGTRDPQADFARIWRCALDWILSSCVQLCSVQGLRSGGLPLERVWSHGEGDPASKRIRDRTQARSHFEKMKTRQGPTRVYAYFIALSARQHLHRGISGQFFFGDVTSFSLSLSEHLYLRL